ncbi:hypothetical protein SAMN05216337_104653 [Bradyrhizobium brasilense]|uniref:Uncharacterized protein n=1 Tax=Bradyrhizobium brasilense TaxID=1419277 RepID=A0A1G7IWG5_9BRAD|nr:hypothetical protein SAMN05216337_104653 [Bradyrhizobium brasilense]
MVCVSSLERGTVGKDSSPVSGDLMLTFKERRPAVRTLRRWAISVSQNAGAIRECDEHGWMQGRAACP